MARKLTRWAPRALGVILFAWILSGLDIDRTAGLLAGADGWPLAWVVPLYLVGLGLSAARWRAQNS